MTPSAARVSDGDGDTYDEWRLDINVNQALVMDLTEIFFEVIYPVFPFFHRPSLLRKVARGEHLTNRPLGACVMAITALASARVRDNALGSNAYDLASLQDPCSERLFDAAERAMPRDAPLTQSFDYMRASVILAIAAIQYGKPSLMNHYLGIYHTFVAVGALHDEANWPRNLTAIELEERRRLFWSTYTLDIFTSVVWAGVARSREASSSVCYPQKGDFDLDCENTHSTAALNHHPHWLQGWNFVTDLYRILEHAVDNLRRLRTPVRRTPVVQALFEDNMVSQFAVLDQIMAMYDELPDIFKTTKQPTANLNENLFSFQAANIAATIQLVRMVYFANSHSTLEQKCLVAGEVIAGFASVPVAYLRAISSPLLHHLAEIGSILGAAFEDGMTRATYHSVRSVLLDLAKLLADLEVYLFCPPGASKKLHTQVSRIDQFMNAELQLHTSRPVDVAIEGQAGPAARGPAISAGQALLPVPTADYSSPQYHFPPELLEDWTWALDFA
ncbi:hypothetical protein LTR86_010727 [Recurvomyces mirabilis]|nr:hypothetical protein LTR86_010727 [Recurvomyces mirabilis]